MLCFCDCFVHFIFLAKSIYLYSMYKTDEKKIKNIAPPPPPPPKKKKKKKQKKKNKKNKQKKNIKDKDAKFDKILSLLFLFNVGFMFVCFSCCCLTVCGCFLFI